MIFAGNPPALSGRGANKKTATEWSLFFDSNSAPSQVVDPIHLVTDQIRGTAFAVTDAQDELPAGTLELVDEAFEAIQQLDFVGGNGVTLAGDCENVLAEKGADFWVHAVFV